MKKNFQIGDRVVSINPHAGHIISSGHRGTVKHVDRRIGKDVVYVSWDDANENLKNYEEYGIWDHSGWSVWETEIYLDEDSVGIEFNLDFDELFERV